MAKNSGIEVIQNFLKKNHIFYQHDRFFINPNKPLCCLYLWQLIRVTQIKALIKK